MDSVASVVVVVILLVAVGASSVVVNIHQYNKLDDVSGRMDTLQMTDAGLQKEIDNVSYGQVDWDDLLDVPFGFADDVDDDTTYSNGTGVNLTDTVFSLDSSVAGENLSWNDVTRQFDASDQYEADTNLSGESAGGELTGTFPNPSLTDSALDDQYITDEEEGNLDVNSSDYWDFYDTPSGISLFNLGDVSDSANDLEFLQYNQSSSNWNPIPIETTYYNATQSQMIEGTVDGGTLSDTQHTEGDYDGVSFNFSETSGSPALDLRINFTGIDRFDRGVMRYKTSELKGTSPRVQMWNYNSSSWDNYPAIGISENFAVMTEPVFYSQNLIQDGVAQMRIYKADSGKTGNHYYVDWISISKGFGTPSGEEVDPLSIHRDGNVSLTANWDVGDYNISADCFKGDNATINGTTTTDVLNLIKLSSAPASPSDGDIVYADGTGWDPDSDGSSEIVAYNGTGWNEMVDMG